MVQPQERRQRPWNHKMAAPAWEQHSLSEGPGEMFSSLKGSHGDKLEGPWLRGSQLGTPSSQNKGHRPGLQGSKISPMRRNVPACDGDSGTETQGLSPTQQLQLAGSFWGHSAAMPANIIRLIRPQAPVHKTGFSRVRKKPLTPWVSS